MNQSDIIAYRQKLGMLMQEELQRRAITVELASEAVEIPDLDAILNGARFPTIEELILLCRLLGENLRIGWERDDASVYELTDPEWRLIRAVRERAMVDSVFWLGVIYGEDIRTRIEDIKARQEKTDT